MEGVCEKCEVSLLCITKSRIAMTINNEDLVASVYLVKKIEGYIDGWPMVEKCDCTFICDVSRDCPNVERKTDCVNDVARIKDHIIVPRKCFRKAEIFDAKKYSERNGRNMP